MDVIAFDATGIDRISSRLTQRSGRRLSALGMTKIKVQSLSGNRPRQVTITVDPHEGCSNHMIYQLK
jgi:hypothetical protein